MNLIYIGSNLSSRVGNSYTSAAVPIGVAASTRRVVVALIGEEIRTVLTATIGGVAATVHATQTNQNAGASVFSAIVPSGTTADIVANMSDTLFGGPLFAVYTLDNSQVSNGNTPNASFAFASNSTTLTIPYTGFVNGPSLLAAGFSTDSGGGYTTNKGFVLNSPSHHQRYAGVLNGDVEGATSVTLTSIALSNKIGTVVSWQPLITDTAPVNTVPSTQNAGVNVAKSITGISVTDANNNLSTTRLTATGGTIYLSLLGGAIINQGANNSSQLTLSGTQTQINAALSTLGYIGTVLGTQTITVLSTDTTGTPLTDTDVISITVKDAYVVDNTAFNVTGVLSNGVVLDSNKKWVLPTGTTTWTFTVQKLSAIHTAAITLNLNSVASAGVSSATINPATNIFITEAAYPLLTSQQRTAVETTGGGYPLIVVTKNAGDTTDAFDVTMSDTFAGTYTTYLIDQLFAPTAVATGNIERSHDAFAIISESGMPTTVAAGTKALLYDTAGKSEWFEISSISTKTDATNTSSIRLIENSKTAIWDNPMPIAIDIDQIGRIALLTSPVIGTSVIADGVQKFFKIIPKQIGVATVNPASVTPIPLMIKSKSRKPFPVRDVRFVRNESPEVGSAFPEGDISEGATNVFVYPSSRTESATSGFYAPTTTFESGVTVHMDVKTVGGETLIRTLTLGGGLAYIHYSQEMRTIDIQRYSTQYEIYTKKNGIESDRFVHVVNQRIGILYNNSVTAVATTILASNIRGAVTLKAAEGGASGTGQETGTYLVSLSGTLLPTINMDTMTIENGAATISSYDNITGDVIVLAPRSLTGFVLIVPFTGTGTISIFAGGMANDDKAENGEGITSSPATI